MNLKEMLEFAGVDTTKGKAKKLLEAIGEKGGPLTAPSHAVRGKEQDLGGKYYREDQGLSVFTDEGEKIIIIDNLSYDMSEDQWMQIWNRSLPPRVADFLATEDPHEGLIAGPEDDGKYPTTHMSMKEYFQYVVRRARNLNPGV